MIETTNPKADSDFYHERSVKKKLVEVLVRNNAIDKYKEQARMLVKERISEREQLCLLPRRCFLTGKPLFMKRATRLSIVFYDNGGTTHCIDQNVWVSKNDYLMTLMQ